MLNVTFSIKHSKSRTLKVTLATEAYVLAWRKTFNNSAKRYGHFFKTILGLWGKLAAPN